MGGLTRLTALTYRKPYPFTGKHNEKTQRSESPRQGRSRRFDRRAYRRHASRSAATVHQEPCRCRLVQTGCSKRGDSAGRFALSTQTKFDRKAGSGGKMAKAAMIPTAIHPAHPPRLHRTFRQLNEEVGQGHSLRRPLYEAIEGELGADQKLIAFFTSFSSPVMIDDQDADMIEEALQNTDMTGKRLVLMINSAGGEALAAERIVTICRSYSKDGFSVIVP